MRSRTRWSRTQLPNSVGLVRRIVVCCDRRDATVLSTCYTWDNVSAGSIPPDINDATTTPSGTTNTSYIYGDLLLGGTAPIEQITTTSSRTSVSYR